MIKGTLPFVFLFSCLCSAAQYSYLPYGVLRVNERLVADQTEILVYEWLGYIISVCDSNPTHFLRVERKLTEPDKVYLRGFRYPDSLLPDKSILPTLEWRDLLDTTNGYRTFKSHGSNSHQTIAINAEYLLSKKKRKRLDYMLGLPVTGITFEQAQDYCRWRTKIDSIQTEGWELHYTFRLPTIAEFAQMNQQFDSTISKSWHFGILSGYEAWPVGFNYRNAPSEYLSSFSRSNDLQDGWEYGPDKLGYYAVQGNAAEMTSREGAACGGSYFHFAAESYHFQIQVYEHAERWLGFRCVATIQ